ncbi:multiubiquitin domain-containing protein [Fulvivirgaceae bacterium PWU4]|uniref:Multiubiquitin domain-containing protein n=1 Tax=Chryseosolibacter histidini TaxID=2782349 RepID=A0AAP2GP80_9BACT|nr:multiubiquitin domain-containing protein [Chryseosolibacter histidini]MBT1697147.1 multiubiquitin domain-containing protein [Chryseosolibacter histidini]
MEKEKQAGKKQVVDIEEFSKSGKPVPKGQQYLIRVDNQRITLTEYLITGEGILMIAGKNPPTRFQLNLKLRGGIVKRIGLNETVDLSEPGIERFMTIPMDQTEG